MTTDIKLEEVVGSDGTVAMDLVRQLPGDRITTFVRLLGDITGG